MLLGLVVFPALVSESIFSVPGGTPPHHTPPLAVQGKYAEAEKQYKRAIEILEKTLGPNHQAVAAVLNNLAELPREHVRAVKKFQTKCRKGKGIGAPLP